MTSRADVPTRSPERYAKQLLAHLGHKLTFVTEGATSTAEVGQGTAQVIVGTDVLRLQASGADEQAVALVEHVLGSHLQRFAHREDLTVSWVRDVQH